MNSDDTKLSKSLSWLLRHGAAKEGLTFDDGGFIDVDKILKLNQFRDYNESNILKIVAENDKKRFSVRYKNNGDRLQVRANQGHTIPVEEEGLLTLLTDANLPKVIYHGTYFSKLESIKTNGLMRMSRNHIHFVSKFPTESVTSGIRQNSEIVIAVDALQAWKDGYKFYVSENEVVLSPGKEKGAIQAKYITEVWQLNPLKKLE
ncbi:hypothetical protein JTE90_027481 [Oedothorax gibbosus]|uniref:2'-phosphotransferase n=1 Tax=Oedothorax gibbosus TaxID=931172 RepID=A0AAV6UH72_9ARAC|nr:hypothetical protein JTE90_027481 [Oedothorax gibbosus]